MFSPFPVVPEKRQFPLKISYLVTFGVALIVLVGTFGEMPFLRSFVPGYPVMQPAAVISFLALGGGIAAVVHRRGRAQVLMIRSVGSVIAAGSIFVLVSFAARSLAGIDAFGRPSLLFDAASLFSSVNFLLLGLSILLLGERARANRIADRLVLISLAIAFAVAIAELFHVSEDSGTPGFGGFAIPTVFLFLVNGCALMIVNPASRLAEMLFSDSVGGRAARQLIPAAVLVPTTIGFFRIIGQEMGLYGTGFGSTMAASLIVIMMCAMVSYYSRKVHKADEERAVAVHELAKRESRYRDLFDYSQSIISTHDLNGKLLSVNRAFVDSLGYHADRMIGTRYDEFIVEKYRIEYPAYLRQIVHNGEAKGLVSMVGSDGRTVVWQYSNVLISESDGDAYVLGSAIDVTHLMKIQNELERSSLTDELTGLYNRRGFLTLVEQQLKLESHDSTARGLTLMFADMDGLKKINDTLGHEAGSDAISTLAKILRSVVRSGDLVARWGGDEFVILSVGAAEENIRMMSERIESSLEEYNLNSGKPYDVACSIGVVPVRLDGRTVEEIIAEADEAMYEEKQRRKASRQAVAPPVPSFGPSFTSSLESSFESSPMPDSFAWY